MFMWGKTNLHQDKIVHPLHMPSILPPISFPPPAHSLSVPIPLPVCPQPTLRPSPAHSPSTPSPLPFRSHPTLPSPLLPELVHLLPCLLQQVTCSSVPSFPCPLAPSPVSSDKQPVHSSTRQPVNLQCYSSNLFICYPVSSCHQRVPLSPFPLSSYPVNTIYYPLILPLLVNYFYHLTFLSVLV